MVVVLMSHFGLRKEPFHTWNTKRLSPASEWPGKALEKPAFSIKQRRSVIGRLIASTTLPLRCSLCGTDELGSIEGPSANQVNQRMTPVATTYDELEIAISHWFAPYCQQPRAFGAADAEIHRDDQAPLGIVLVRSMLISI
jgi:hypothetical protein